MQSPKPGVVFRGRYVLEEILGRGGMGSVWLARDRSLGRMVAVKFMHGRLEGSRIARKRFEREAQLTAKLQSRHVVRVLDHGVEGTTPFIVMELLEGEDLSARLQRKGPLDLEEATWIVGEVCRGLRRAHEAGLVHRDLKPANVFCTTDETGSPVVKILDFGVVKAMASTFEASIATESGAIVGSVHYASPEQAQGERDLDPRSDVWSVAALAFRLITGQLPFGGDALGAVVLAICSRPPPRVTEVAPHLPRELDAVFLRAFERDRDRRFQTAIDFADAFFAAAVGADAAPRSMAVPPLLGEPTPAPGRGHLDSFEESETRVATPAATRVVDLTAEAARSVGVEARAAGDVDEGATRRMEVAEKVLDADATRVLTPPSLDVALDETAPTTALTTSASSKVATELETTAGAVEAGLRSSAALHRHRRPIAFLAAGAAAALLAFVVASFGGAAGEGETVIVAPPSAPGAAPPAAPGEAAPALPTSASAVAEDDATTVEPVASVAASASAGPAPRGAPRPRRPTHRCKDPKGRPVPCEPMYTPHRP